LAYIALYRKWRPQKFEDVVGQPRIVQTLVNSLKAGRISHAYLFAGPRGTGKTTVARLLAKGLNCKAGPTADPCGDCFECRAVLEGTSLNVVEIDGASNRGIDDVRELRSQVQFTPVNARYKVYIIDEVHMLTPEAFNALLKTLEEPPAHVVFIFATTDPHRLPPTILSRVQRYDFQRFTEADIVARLQTVVRAEGFKAEEEALELIAKHAEGGMRDALGILEKCAAYASKIEAAAVAEVLGVAPREQVLAFITDLLGREKVACLKLIDALYNEGKDISQFVRAVLHELRARVVEAAQDADLAAEFRAIEVFAEALKEMRFAVDPRIPLEVAVLKITVGGDAADNAFVSELESKILVLEKELAKLKAQRGRAEMAAAKEETPSPPRPGKNDEELSSFILENWEGYLQTLRANRLMQCEAFLREGTPTGVADNALIVAFPRDRGFHKASIEQENHRLPAERLLAKFAGTNLGISCTFLDESPKEPEEAAFRAGSGDEAAEKKKKEVEPQESGEDGLKPEEEDFIAASKEIFGGEVFTGRKES